MPGPQEARFAAPAQTGFSVTAATRDRDRSSAIDAEDCGAAECDRWLPPRFSLASDHRRAVRRKADHLTAGRLSSYTEGSSYEHDMPVENCECGVGFAGAEPRKIWLSTNQSTGIPSGREPEAAKHGCPITARHDGLTRGVAEHLMTPLAAEVRSRSRRGAGTPPFRCNQRRARFAALWTAGDELSPFP